MSLENGNGNKSTSPSSSPHPEHDEEREYQIRRIEMRRIQKAQAQQQAEAEAEAENRRQRRIDACDLTYDEFKIVCEELWIDFKTWVHHHEDLKNSFTKTRNAIRRNLATIFFIFAFFIGFRWYIGGGREACAKFGIAGIMLNFMCEVFRYIGEALLGVFLGIIGFCVGVMPLVVCVCVFEFKDAFPDPVDHEDHLKKD